MTVIRHAFQAMGIECRERDGRVHAVVKLENLAVHVVAWARPRDLAKAVVRLPIRVPGESLGPVAEFLHRLNLNARRKYWEFDCDRGEVRLACFIDTLHGPLMESHFAVLLRSLTSTADAAFPNLISVLLGNSPPSVAARSAEASIQSGWKMEVSE